MNKEYVHKKADSSPATSPESRTFQARAFGVQAKAEGAAKEQVEAAPGSDNLLKRVRVSQRTAIQPKLAIGTPGDRYEREADAIALRVMNAPERAIAANITPIGSGDAIQNKAAGEGSAPAGGSSLESQLNQSNTGGTPLSPQVRAFMEPRIGADFSAVRVHADAGAARMNQQLSAQAFTYGNHIYYGAGKSPSNDALTAHELIHVEQQTGNGGARSAGSIQRKVVPAKTKKPDPWSSAELLKDPKLRDADRAGGQFTKKDTPLFPKDNKPNADDIKQGGLGDCYLEASLASLAAEQPDYIKQMMRDNGDGTVTVRLYEVDQSDMKNHKFTPKYIKVKKSVATDETGKEIYNKGALWAQMVQKAYAAGGFTSTGEAPVSSSASYENITDGVVRYALEVLLGHQSTLIRLQGGVVYDIEKDEYIDKIEALGFKGKEETATDIINRNNLPWDKQTVENYDKVKSLTPNDYSPLALLMDIFKQDTAKIDAWMAFVKQEGIKNLFKNFREKRKADIGFQITLSDFDSLFKGQTFKDDIMSWIKEQNIISGDLGKGIYSQIQLDRFKDIKEALNNHKVVAANTMKTITEGRAEGAGANGEQKAGGLFGGHAYSVLGYRENASTDPDNTKATGKFYWLKLRNPWGNTGRKYKITGNKWEGFEDKAGTFWLELSEFTKYFAVVSYA